MNIQLAPNALEALVQTVLNTLGSEHSKKAYGPALAGYLRWSRANSKPPGRLAVQEYVQVLLSHGKRPSTINVMLSAVRKLYQEAEDNGWIDAATCAGVQRVKGLRRLGEATGNWLSNEDAVQLLRMPDMQTVLGLRDAALIALLYGCAFRRSEACSLRIEQLQEREGRWVWVDVIGKAARLRAVVVPRFTEDALVRWRDHRLHADQAKADAFYLRSMEGNTLSVHGLVHVLKQYVGRLGRPEIAPHDMRRSFARHALEGGAPMTQIALTLGHSSAVVTERYVGVRQDWKNPAADFLMKKTAGHSQ